MITIKKPDEIEMLREGGIKLARILDKVIKKVKPGVTTLELDRYAEKLIKKAGGRPAFKNFEGFSGTLCTSVNEAVVHGVPSEKTVLKEGDIVGLDVGMQWPAKDGFYTDMARTVPVGDVTEEAKRIMKITKESFYKAVDVIHEGARVGDIGAAIQDFVEPQGYSLVRSLSGHGVGYKVHEAPTIPNFGDKGTGEVLKAGMVLAIEPMVCQGDYELETLDDGWTAVTSDGLLSSHHENTLVVTRDGCEILTSS